MVVRAVASEDIAASPSANAGSGEHQFLNPKRPLKVLIAGAGIGGLVLAVALLRKGVQVQLFERDMTAIRGEGKYRGPIQIQSNALAALEAIDAEMANEVMAAGCVTGDRVNGLVDGVSGEWYVKFDTYHAAVDTGMPVTRVVSRVELQGILAKYARKYGGAGVIREDARVAGFEESVIDGKPIVYARLECGDREWGDILIGADGIWSKIRTQLIGHTDANYSQYTCYTGISDFVAADIDTVGYRVFLGNRQYFVSSDVGGGKMQWYAFHKEPAGGKDVEGRRKERLMQIFGNWNEMVTDLIVATPEEDVLRRDIFDRPPIFTWTKGRVALLGDSAHAMQPNLGQGGCMAIEDAYEMAKLLSDEGLKKHADDVHSVPVQRILKRYELSRIPRAAAIHGMAGAAAFAASTYKAYFGEGLGPLASWLTKLKIPHPGRVSGQVVLKATMPFVLNWVLGGNKGALKAADRAAYCSITDKPRAFHPDDFNVFMSDDEALLRAARADWVLAPVRGAGGAAPSADACAFAIDDGVTLGRGADADVVVSDASTAPRHARIEQDNGLCYLVDCGSSQGTWLNGHRVAAGARPQLHPGDLIELGCANVGPAFRVKIMHSSQRAAGLICANPDGTERRLPVVAKSPVARDAEAQLQPV